MIERMPNSVLDLFDPGELFTINIEESLKTAYLCKPKDGVIAAGQYAFIASLIDIRDFEIIATIERLQKLATNHIFTSISTTLKRRKQTKLPYIPYISILVPSGSGKTQLYYTLRNLYPKKFIRFLLCVDTDELDESDRIDTSVYLGPFSQPINNDLLGLSRSFTRCCMDDIELLLKSQKYRSSIGSCRLFSECGLPLLSMGFAVCVLSIVAKEDYAREFLGLEKEDIIPDLNFIELLTIKPMTYSEALDILSGFKDIPAVFIDGFSASHHQIPYAFARNVFRALGIVCITMEIDSRATQIGMLGDEESSEEPTEWVSVIHKLPASSPKSFPELQTVVEQLTTLCNRNGWDTFIDWIQSLPCKNPRMMRFALEALSKIKMAEFEDKSFPKFFEEFLSATSKRVRNYKRFSSESLVEQIALNFKAWRSCTKNDDLNSCRVSWLIRSYYANLNETEQPIPIVRDEKDLMKDGSQWNPTSYFDEVQGNELFYLVLISQATSLNYFWGEEAYSTGNAFLLYFQKIFPNCDGDTNPCNNSLNGFTMESLCNFVFMISSRKNGFSGTNLADFICELVTQLDLNGVRMCRYAIDEDCHEKYSELIPYLGPMDSNFSDKFRNLVASTGLFIRSLNLVAFRTQVYGIVERILETDPWIVFEWKHWRRHVDQVILGKTIEDAYNKTFFKNETGAPELLFIFAKSMVNFDPSHSSYYLKVLRKRAVELNVVLKGWNITIERVHCSGQGDRLQVFIIPLDHLFPGYDATSKTALRLCRPQFCLKVEENFSSSL